MIKKNVIILLISVFAVILRLYILDDLPGEWYGDISNVHEYMMDIFQWKWPLYFLQSPGPLYHYFIAPIVFLIGQNGYITYKLASLFVSMAGLFAFYLFVKEISSTKQALIGMLIMSVLFWFLVWSRLGNSQIIIPLLSCLLGLFLLRYTKNRKIEDMLIAAIISALGLYTYPHTFILPIVYIFYILLFILYRKIYREEAFKFFVALFLLIGFSIFFFFIMSHQSDDNFSATGYIGSKIIPVFSYEPGNNLKILVNNITRTILMLHVKGDSVFRINVPFRPHLDLFSGLLFIVGIFSLLKEKKYSALFFVLYMITILILPSVSPALPEMEIPNSNRTIAIIPFVYFLVCYGMYFLYKRLSFIWSKNIGIAVTIVIFFVISYKNIQGYFIDYAYGLPDNNSAPGKMIARYIDNRFPQNATLYFAFCCWGEYGQPENKGVWYQLYKIRPVEHSYLATDCHMIKNIPAIVIFSPDYRATDYLKDCFRGYKLDNVISEKGLIIAQIAYIE